MLPSRGTDIERHWFYFALKRVMCNQALVAESRVVSWLGYLDEVPVSLRINDYLTYTYQTPWQ